MLPDAIEWLNVIYKSLPVKAPLAAIAVPLPLLYSTTFIVPITISPPTFTVCVVLCVLYPALLALTVTVNDDVFVFFVS